MSRNHRSPKFVIGLMFMPPLILTTHWGGNKYSIREHLKRGDVLCVDKAIKLSGAKRGMFDRKVNYRTNTITVYFTNRNLAVLTKLAYSGSLQVATSPFQIISKTI